jgi:hypothetical protein
VQQCSFAQTPVMARLASGHGAFAILQLTDSPQAAAPGTIFITPMAVPAQRTAACAGAAAAAAATAATDTAAATLPAAVTAPAALAGARSLAASFDSPARPVGRHSLPPSKGAFMAPMAARSPVGSVSVIAGDNVADR